MLAETTGGTAIMDERSGRRVAEVADIPVRGTGLLVPACVRDGLLAGDVALDAIDVMIDAGWHCSTERYARIRDRIDGFAGA